MKFPHRLLAVASAAFFIAGSALAQNAGTVTNHAFVLGKGAGTTGYTSLLCGSAQLAVGQSAADPICRTLTGDVTLTAAGVTAIGATKVTSAMLNADVFSTAHTWAGQQTFVAPILGTPASGTLTNATGLPVSTGISGLATGIASWLATSSSANLATAVTDETGSGSLVFATSPTLVTPVLGVASATSINKLTITAPATSATLTVPDGVTLTGPASSGTAMTLGNTETVTGVKTFGSSGAVGRLKVAGTTSGSTVLDATAVASGTLTLPAATDTLIGKATTDTLTNKTFDTAGTGNSFSINGVAATANTGTGAVVRATSPTLVTPALGTPASGVATNLTGLPLSGLTAQGAYTIVANNSGSLAVPTAVDVTAITSKASPVSADIVLIQDSAASNAFKRTTVGALSSAGSVSSIAGNTGAFTLANGIDNSTNQIQLTAARRTLPTIQKFTSGSGTYTTPANVLWIEVEMVGGGGGGQGSGSASRGAGGAGGNTTFGSALLTANGGTGGSDSQAALGGTASGGDTNISGGSAVGSFTAPGNFNGMFGAASPFGGVGSGGVAGGAGSAASTNSGSGGGGAGVGSAINVGGGGAAGGYLRKIINTPSSTYSYAVGAAGTAGTAGTSGAAGGAGGSGYIVVTEHYGS